MKIEIVNDDQLDEVVAQALKELLDNVQKANLTHPEDVEFNERLIPALCVVLEAYGE